MVKYIYSYSFRLYIARRLGIEIIVLKYISNSSRMGKNKCCFNKCWLVDEEFRDWLEENSKNCHFFGCKLCRKHDLSLSDTGVAALRRHMTSKKHKDVTTAKKDNGNFFEVRKRKGTPYCSTGKTEAGTSGMADLTSETSHPVPKKVMSMASTKAESIKAEILWTFNCVMENNSSRSNDDKSLLFQTMFPDSNIAKNFRLAKTKFSYYLNDGIGEYLRDNLTATIKTSPHYTVSYDESMNDVLQKCQMDIVVRYWNSDKNEAVSRYYCSKFLGHATAEILKSTFLSAIDEFDHDKMRQCSMDGPKVNLLFYKKLADSRINEEKKPLIDLGTCNLHVLHGAVKTGVKWCGGGETKGCS